MKNPLVFWIFNIVASSREAKSFNVVATNKHFTTTKTTTTSTTACTSLASVNGDPINERVDLDTYTNTINKVNTSMTGVSDVLSAVESRRQKLKEDLLALAFRSERGFKATEQERIQARRLVLELAEYNPSQEPAADFYNENSEKKKHSPETRQRKALSLSGKWTLVYTDAPDIIALEPRNNNNNGQGNGRRLAVLGRIGQECDAPYISNVIEWKRPSWADTWPLLGGTEPSPRILQKVVTRATASPDNPLAVDLKLVGLQVETAHPETSNSIQDSLQRRGLLPTLLDRMPLQWRGPWTLPFGKFEILYLDNDLRIVRTGQGYLAVNRRIQSDAWF